MKGLDILIHVNLGDETTPQWTPVGGQREATFTESVETIETTHKLTNGYKTFEYGFGEWQIELGGLYIFGEEAFEALRNAVANKQKIKAQWVENGGKKYEGMCVVSEISLEGAYDSEATYSCTLVGDGAYQEVVA